MCIRDSRVRCQVLREFAYPATSPAVQKIRYLHHGLLRAAIEISIQIAQGISEAHSHNVIHRDIKPSNIIITKQSVVKIVDFGLALVLSDPSATRSVGNPGTAVYML